MAGDNLLSPSRRITARHPPPACKALGTQCRSLRVLLRIGALEEGRTSLDHEATWLLGHTDRITFEALWADEGDLYADAVLHVPCRYLSADNGRARCSAHGFEGPAPGGAARPPQPRQLGSDRFLVVDGMRLESRTLRAQARGLPVMAQDNPCAGARCRTAARKPWCERGNHHICATCPARRRTPSNPKCSRPAATWRATGSVPHCMA